MYDYKSSSSFPLVNIVGFFNSAVTLRNVNKTKPHKIDEWQIELFTENSGSAIINGTEHKNKAGNLLILPPGTVRSSLLHFKCFYFHIKDGSGMYYDELKKLPMIIKVSDPVEFQKLFQKMIIKFYSNNICDHLEFNILFSKFFSLLLKQNEIQNEPLGIIEKAEQFIIDNCHRDIVLEDIAKSVALSPVYFHRKFIKEKGISPHEYLSQKRVERAKFLLLSSDMELTDIAFDCGFSSLSYFICFFKSKTGMTPGKFRETNFRSSQIL